MKPIVLVIMDGVGETPEELGNMVKKATTPTLDALKDYLREREARHMTRSLALAVYDHGYREDPEVHGHASVPAECERGVDKETRVWWIQAESLIGFLNAAASSLAQNTIVFAYRSVARRYAVICSATSRMRSAMMME